jgi:hypothetical protein
VFLPGLDELADPGAPRLPALEALLARGRSEPGDNCWAALAHLAGGDLARWPVGPVSALAELQAAPAECLRVEPLGMDAEQRGAFRLRAAALGIRPEEAAALAEGFATTFATEGLRLEVATPQRWYLLRDASREGAPWAGFDGPPMGLAPGQRPAPPEPGLRRLLSEVEMLFFAHPVNEARRELGRPLVAGLHPWGGGRIERGTGRATAAAPSLAPQAGEPYLAGLRRLGVLPAAGEKGALEVLWPLAPEALDLARLRELDADCLAGLSQRLRRGQIRRLRLVTGTAVHEVGTLDMLRFWRRSRHWAAAC